MLGRSVFEPTFQEMSKLRWETFRIIRNVNIPLVTSTEKVRTFIETSLAFRKTAISVQKLQNHSFSGFRNKVFSRDVLRILIKSEVFSRQVLRILKNEPKNEEQLSSKKLKAS